MRRRFLIPFVVASVLGVVPGWTGESRLPLLSSRAQMTATRVPLDRSDLTRTRVGRLTYLGGVSLTSRDPAFGGFSSIAVDRDRFTLLSDGGNIVAFRMGADWKPHALRFASLPGGPGSGWDKRDRDSESMTIDPRTGRLWVGFENGNAIWRFAPGFARAQRVARPPAMRDWPVNGGPESLIRLRDGRFVTIAEMARPKRDTPGRRDLREGYVFARDPTIDPRAGFGFSYRTMRGYHPADVTELPDGRLLVLERRFALPFRWSNRLVLVERDAIRPGVMRGRLIAALAPPVIHDNFEGIAAVRENGATILWIVSDNNELLLQRSLLLKFRLD